MYEVCAKYLSYQESGLEYARQITRIGTLGSNLQSSLVLAISIVVSRDHSPYQYGAEYGVCLGQPRYEVASRKAEERSQPF
jgi:hypothetical protein